MNDRKKRVLITGINGFVGPHMGQYLYSNHIRVLGIGRRDVSSIKHHRFEYQSCDLLQPSAAISLIHRFNPDYVIHLAAENGVQESWNNPAITLRSNILAALNIMEAVRRHPTGRFKGLLLIGSAHEYGDNFPDPTPRTEETPLRPSSPYGWSKMLQTQMALMYASLYSVPVIIARTFNLIGPGRSRGICAKIAEQVVEMEQGLRPPKLILGNTKVQRDFLDVRDAVRAYWDLLQLDPVPAGEIFHVCRGSAYSISELVTLFQKHARVSFDVCTDPALIRKNETLILYGNNKKLCSATGWKPAFTLEESIRDLLEETRRRYGEKGGEEK
ncbi:GDP-mannose 4,6-dehydratase [Lihuaxuella thermophila]|uniref:GDP-4-dehydro-6-deoxy-D-mannose reductase n=1 Tax=Lihuaxuella thermophila TaxID=1173111 RepID=A0A1H8DXL7_9BACL|nr:GDP-mannose 4,6-dehydratase [Lihuaxuella thermophila]SEN12012.1 GDP-4-dehydro-6-deoxy-D-mannose reductase [Lihuaxuella thermophila]